MYEAYWKLTQKPFQNTPDPRFFYKSAEHDETLMRLLYTAEQGLGAGMLTGVFGCGKTMISQAICDKLPPDKYKIGLITNPQVDFVELLRAIVRNLKAVELPTKRTELSSDSLLEILGNILENNALDGKKTVVIIDEAHVIKDPSIFEQLRLLLNFQKRDMFLLTLFLFGQPELKQKVEDIKQLDQRIAIKCRLEAFGEEDTQNYIIHRLSTAGRPDVTFDDNALKMIHGRSGGIPRRINRICDFSLLVGMYQNATIINKDIVEESLQSVET